MTLTDLLGIDLAIIQAPMAGVQTSELALAVSKAGGLGSLPAALLTVASLEAELRRLRTEAVRPYNVNFFCHADPTHGLESYPGWIEVVAPYFEELGLTPAAPSPPPARAAFTTEVADIVESFAPPIVSFHFGLPPDHLLQRVRAWGAKIISSATTVDEARWLEARGVDAIIAQGSEAGGHRGMFLSTDVATQVGTFALVPQIVRAVGVPVIAAGGIATSSGIRAALQLGASGVQVGTGYLLCPETTTSPLYRAALKSDESRSTALTNIFTGRPARAIVNRLMRTLGHLRADVPAFPLPTAIMGQLRAAAENKGSVDFSPFWCGQNASECREIPAAALTQELASGI